MRGAMIALVVFGIGATGYFAFGSSTANAEAHANSASAADPMQRLLEGNLRYVSGQLQHDHQSVDRRSELAKGQKPFAIIVGCADSRVPPEIVFDQGLGDLFVVRCAGNICEDASIASIEYAVEHLGAQLVVVLGHERCGAVDAVVKGGELPGHLSSFAKAIGSAVEATKSLEGDRLDLAVRRNVANIVDQLSHCGPILEEKVESGALTIVGARYDLDDGKIEVVSAAPASPNPSPTQHR